MSGETKAIKKVAFPTKKYPEGYFNALQKNIRQNKGLYLMLLPVVLFYLVFHYQPMYGLQIAFKNFTFKDGILGSEWVGFAHFQSFFSSIFFWRLMRNTLAISVKDILFGFPAPVIFAVLLNEIRNKHCKKTIQSLTYIPHFISVVVVCSMVKDFLSIDGVINEVMGFFGVEAVNFLAVGEYFSTIYVATNVWQELGWGTIIYLAALSGIDPMLYEAARIDGAGKLRQIFNITFPSILPTVTIMFILKTGKVLSIGAEKVLLLYNETIYEHADVISTYVYRKGLEDANYSYSAAVGLFNAVINFALLYAVNQISKKTSENSLW